ncbi:MAG: serpin family protein [Prevotella sp.]|nr:serpin family protein [Prevotella sp.]
MKKYLFLMAAMAIGSMLMLSCSTSDEDSDTVKKVVNMVADIKPIQLTEPQKLFVNDNNQFALNYLKTANDADKSEKSFIYSPLSITYVLGMVNDATTGQTEKELEQTLGFHEGGIQAVNDYCKNLIDNLPKVDEKVTLNIANAIFLNKNYVLKSQFEADMKTYYDAKAATLDFNDVKKSTEAINKWCNEKTRGMIPNIIDAVKPDAMSYLLNAIYFKADWTSKFDPKNTKNETFTTQGGTTKLPMMHQDVLIRYTKNETYSAVEIPYGNKMWTMTVLLPEDGKTTDDVIDYLAQTGWTLGYANTPMSGARTHEVDLKLPRYETSSDTDNMEGGLISLLQKMGIHRTFDSNNTEICNMCSLPVYISMMRQKAKIKVNEEGSEAAAVTVAEGYVNAAMPETIPTATFHADHPFVYVIREASSGVILFVGKFTGA